jgi:hypothetical protein
MSGSQGAHEVSPFEPTIELPFERAYFAMPKLLLSLITVTLI